METPLAQKATPGNRTAELPPPYQPFVVRDDFVVRADLFPLPGEYNGRREERHFELDNQFERFLGERLASLGRDVDKYRCIDTAEPAPRRTAGRNQPRCRRRRSRRARLVPLLVR